MPTTGRPLRLLALVTLAVVSAAFAFGTTDEPDKKLPNKKTKTSADNSVQLRIDPCEFVCYDAIPHYALVVDYTAAEEGLEVAVTHSGYPVAPQGATKGSGSLTFALDYAADTTEAFVTVSLRSKTDPTDVKATETRYHLCFLKGGMGMMAAAPTAARVAAKEGAPVPAGTHRGEFRAVDKLFAGAQARFWVQGRFKNGPPKLDYDLPATVTWFKRADGKYVPKWCAHLPEQLKAEPLSINGEEPRTFVVVALLNDKGRVIDRQTYNYGK